VVVFDHVGCQRRLDRDVDLLPSRGVEADLVDARGEKQVLLLARDDLDGEVRTVFAARTVLAARAALAARTELAVRPCDLVFAVAAGDTLAEQLLAA
jgi:hypothetical protein